MDVKAFIFNLGCKTVVDYLGNFISTDSLTATNQH